MPQTETVKINVSRFIDERPISGVQWRVVALCFLIAMVDGFDTQAIAFVAPIIRGLMNIGPQDVGKLYSAGLIGLMLGALVFGPVADRIGRKPVIILSCAIMGGFSLMTATADSLTGLLVFRFLTGLGLGAAMPNINSLTAEYAPERNRALLMTLMFAGFPAGAILGGIISVELIDFYGWQSVFVLGGVTPLLLALALGIVLPESLSYQVTRNPADLSVGRMLARIDSSFLPTQTTIYSVADAGVRTTRSKMPMRDLFTEHRTAGTLLIWLIYFSNLLMMYSLLAWLPTILSDAGLGLAGGIYTAVAFNCGGVVGGLVMARLIDRKSGYAALFCGYLLAAATGALIGGLGGNLWWALTVVFVSGLTLMGAAFAMNAVTALFYPTYVRSTGLGWGLAIGRIGAIIGPVGIGAALSGGWTTTMVFTTIASLGTVSAAGIALLRLAVKRQSQLHS